MYSASLSRPELPSQLYTLFLPWHGVYLRLAEPEQGQLEAAADCRDASPLPEARARALGLEVIRATGEPVELRSPMR